MRQTFQTLKTDRTGSVEWLTLNRPDRLNALDSRMMDELNAYFLAVAEDPDVRIIVIRGAGRAFCAGLDIKEPRADDAYEIPKLLERQRAVANIILNMRRAPQAIISLVHGAASGGGFAIALASDIRIAGESARMNAAFIRIGLSACDVGVSYLLPRLVGASVASELMFTGNFIDAPRALATGLVSRVVPDDALEAAAEPYLEAMRTTSPIGLRMTKECLRMSIDAPSLESAIAMEDRTQVICVASGAFAKGIAAFSEKRTPDY